MRGATMVVEASAVIGAMGSERTITSCQLLLFEEVVTPGFVSGHTPTYCDAGKHTAFQNLPRLATNRRDPRFTRRHFHRNTPRYLAVAAGSHQDVWVTREASGRDFADKPVFEHYSCKQP